MTEQLIADRVRGIIAEFESGNESIARENLRALTEDAARLIERPPSSGSDEFGYQRVRKLIENLGKAQREAGLVGARFWANTALDNWLEQGKLK